MVNGARYGTAATCQIRRSDLSSPRLATSFGTRFLVSRDWPDRHFVGEVLFATRRLRQAIPFSRK